MMKVKKTKLHRDRDNCLFVDAERIMVLIKQFMSAESDEEDNSDSLSPMDFLQCNGGSAGLLDIKRTPSKPVLGKYHCFSNSETSHSLSACVVLCILCYQQDRTPLKAAIQKIQKGAISHVQKHMKMCHSAEI